MFQTESIMASLAGKNVVVATMTSSGKSLCYNVPVLEELSQNLSSCALYLFPTKVMLWQGLGFRLFKFHYLWCQFFRLFSFVQMPSWSLASLHVDFSFYNS